MEEFSLDIFRNFADQNQTSEFINQANAILSDNIANPELAIFILNTYFTPEVQNDQILIYSMAIVFYKIVDYVWKLYPNKLDQYNTDVYSHIRDQIIPMYINTPQNFQNIIIDAIRDIIRYEDYNSEDIVTNVCNFIEPQQDLHVISFVFQILERYSYAVGISKEEENRAEPFCDNFTQIWSVVAPQMQESFSTQPNTDSFQIVKNAADILKYLLVKAEDSLLKPETTNLIQFFIDTLTVQNSKLQCIQMKESVLLFFKASLRTQERQQYTEWIQQTFLESMPQIIPQVFQTVSGSTSIGALGALMDVFYTLINQKEPLEWFFTKEFIYDYLIPAARLTESDLSDFELSPNYYIGFAICNVGDADSHNKDWDDLIPRFICALIMSTLISKVPDLFIFDLTQFEDPLDLEAYLYLIYQGYLAHHHIPMDEEQYSQIFDLLNTPDLPEYIYPSILCALQNNIIKNNYELLKAVSSSAYEIIMDPKINLIAVVSSLAVFRKTIKSLSKNNDLESLIDIKEFIQRLIQISGEVNTPEVQNVMAKLIKYCTSQIIEFSHDLFESFSEFLEEISKFGGEFTNQQELEANSITDTFFLLFDVQKDHGEKEFFVDQIISLSVHIIQEYPNSISICPIIDLCGSVSEKINIGELSDELKSTLLQFVHFILEHLASSENPESIYLFPDWARVITPLIPILDEELTQNIQSFCLNIFEQVEREEEMVLAASLIVLSNIILAHEENIADLTQFAFEQMSSNDEDAEFSNISVYCIFVLTAALFKTNGSFASEIPDEILQIWYESSNVSDLQNQREIHTFALGLLILASQENKDAYQVAGDLLHQNWEVLQKEMEEEEEFLDETNDLQKIYFPIDNENASKLFFELINKFGPPDDYEEEFQKWICDQASVNQ